MTRWLAVVAACCLLSLTAAGQPVGDWNGDGAVNGIDFVALEPCLTGPDATPSVPCATAFDIDGSNAVDMVDVLRMQRNVVGGSADCGDIYQYVAASLKNVSVVGAAANIRTRIPILCGEEVDRAKASHAMVALAKSETSANAQVGYVRGIGFDATGPFAGPPGSPGTFFRIYAEVYTGRAVENYVRVWFQSPPSGNPRYSCVMISPAQGYWQMTVEDDLGFFTGVTITHAGAVSGWVAGTATKIDYTAEMFNAEDRAPGSAELTCDFTNCMYILQNGLPVLAEFDPRPEAQGGNMFRGYP